MGGANASARNANSAPSAAYLEAVPSLPARDLWCRTLRRRGAARKLQRRMNGAPVLEVVRADRARHTESTEEAARVGTTKKSTDQNRVAKGLSAATRSLLVSSVLYVSLSSGDAAGRFTGGASRG